MPSDETSKLQNRIDELEDENGRLLAKIDRLELEQSQPNVSQTIHGLSVMVLQLDGVGRISYINSSFEAYLGIKRSSVINKPLDIIDSSTMGKGYLKLIYKQAMEANSNINLDHQYRDPQSGAMRYARITASRVSKGCQILVEDQSTFKRLESTFKRYVAPGVIDEMIKGGFDLHTPRKYEMTVMFADLRGFTKLCNDLTPEQVKWIIDRFLGVMMAAIIDEGATVDKLVGDEIMSLFGAPIRYPDHAVRAVNTALRMQRQHQLLMEEWKAAGIPDPPPMGIGINTGEMIVGNIGSEIRMNYTVLGHHVNLAARLCSAAKGSEILISPRTFEFARTSLEKDPAAIKHTVKFKTAPTLMAKGINKPIKPIKVVAI